VASGASTGNEVPFDHLWAYAVRVRDGRVAWFRAYFDADEALAAGGCEATGTTD
jgi:ketosteroid isomerase-like protein